MKVCPICQSTYEATVDFCFKDGAPLELQASEDSPEPPVAADFAALTMEELEPPEAVSLSGLVPVATPEDDLKTLTMASEPPPQLDEDELATVTSGVQPVAKAEEPAPQRDEVSDPFAQQEGGDSGDRTGGSQPVWQLGPDGDSAGAADIEDRMETVQWQGKPAGVPTAGGGGFLRGILAVASLLALLIGYQIFVGGAPEPVVQNDPTAAPGQEVEEEPAPLEVSEPATESGVDTAEVVDEGAPAAEDTPDEGDTGEVSLAEPEVEEGQSGQPEPDESEPEPQEDASSQSSSDEAAAAEAREQRDRERRERERLDRRKKDREDKRAERQAKAAEDRAARAAANSKAEEKRAAAQAAAGKSEPARGNPWTSPPASAPAVPSSGGRADPGNPWGVNTPAAAPARTTVSVRTKPAGAKVKIAGKSRGKSPVKADLPQGTHEIEVSKEGYLPRSSYVKVKDSEPVSVSIALEPVASASAKREGTLFISSSPSGALLYVDGSSKGRTPISVAVTEGAHSLKLVSDGREPVEKRIKVDFARSTTVRRFIEIP